MKILAIRGKNLASLAREFELDMDQGPLGQAGIFAITGPTGAGKTTLLDAMCLALFDKLPRLENAPSHKIATVEGELDIKSHDVRNILRRGAAACMAGVDFLGGDGVRYRSTWTLHRAKHKADGRVQSQEMTLEILDRDGQIGDHKKTETLRLITEKLGLTFDQFCRSVLLAQGQFSAFLRAKSAERSQLLERMTGTDIYSRLSIAAFETAKQEEAALAELEQQLGHFPVLTPVERAELDGDLQAATAAKARCEQEVGRLTQARDWFVRQDQLQRAVEEATARLEAAKTGVMDLADSAAELNAVISVQPLRSHLQAFDRAAEAHAGVEAGLKIDEDALTAAQARQQDSEQKLAEQRTAHAASVDELEAAKPVFLRARELDTKKMGNDDQTNQAKIHLHAAREAADQAREDWLRGCREKSNLEQTLALTETWLANHTADAAVVSAWPLLSRELERFVHNSERLAKAGRVMPDMQETQRSQAAQKAATDASMSEAESLWRDAQALAQEVEKAAVEAGQSVWGERAEALDQERVAWRGVLDLVEAHGKLLTERKDLEEARQRFAVEKDEAALIDISRQIELNQAALREAQGGLRLTESTEDLSAKRDLLRDGQPCPLCGGLDHPFGEKKPVLSQLLASQRARVKELQEIVGELQRQQAELKSRVQIHGKELKRLAVDEERLNAAISRAEAARDEAAQQLQAFSSEAVIAERDFLSKELLRLEAQSKALKRKRDQAELAGRDAAAKRKAADDARDALAKIRDAAIEQERALAEMDARLVRCTEELTRLREEHSLLLEGLAPLFAIGFEPADLEADPAGFIEKAANRVETWIQADQRRSGSRERLVGVEKDLAVLKQKLSQLEAYIPKYQNELDGLLEVGLALGKARAGLLDGNPVDQVEQKMTSAVNQLNVALRTAETLDRDTAAACVAIRARLADRREQCTERLKQKNRANEDLQQGLADFKLDLATARKLLTHDAQWIEAQRAVHIVADQELEKAKTVWAERGERLEEHMGTNQPKTERDLLQTQFSEAKEQLVSAGEQLNELSVKLRMDDHNRSRVAELLPKLEVARVKAEQWDIMRRIIGSADGKKFRTFAQSLTLDALVTCADVHLRELEPRYCLQRVPGEDLDLQVIDRFMADEVRSLSSLSGGESFLVSLALALGLSTLSSNRTHIGSLFIDEGFSTLDARTLDTALAALEALQAAGLQIGIISHLPAITERVSAHVTLIRSSGGSSLVQVKSLS